MASESTVKWTASISYSSLPDLTRQYKTMQSQLDGKVEFLEAQVRRLQKTLGKREVVL